MSNKTYQQTHACNGDNVGTTYPQVPERCALACMRFLSFAGPMGPSRDSSSDPWILKARYAVSQEGMFKEPHWRGEKEHLGTKSMVKDMYNPLQGESKALQLHSQNQRRSEAAAGVCRTPPS